MARSLSSGPIPLASSRSAFCTIHGLRQACLHHRAHRGQLQFRHTDVRYRIPNSRSGSDLSGLSGPSMQQRRRMPMSTAGKDIFSFGLKLCGLSTKLGGSRLTDVRIFSEKIEYFTKCLQDILREFS